MTYVWAAALKPKQINRSARMRPAGQRPVVRYIAVTLVNFDKQSNGRRIEVES